MTTAYRKALVQKSMIMWEGAKKTQNIRDVIDGRSITCLDQRMAMLPRGIFLEVK